MSDSNDTESTDAVYMHADMALPGRVLVKVIGGRVQVFVGEAPWLATFSMSRDAAEQFGEDLDAALDELGSSEFGPVRTFGLIMDDTNRTGGFVPTVVK